MTAPCYICNPEGLGSGDPFCPECRGSGQMKIEMPPPAPPRCSICGEEIRLGVEDETGLVVCVDHM